MKGTRGLTILEVMIALAVIAVAFAALAFTQLTSLRSSSRSRLVSETKTVANNVMQDELAKVLLVGTVTSTSPYLDATFTDPTGTTYKSYYFIDFYYSCPGVVTSLPADVRSGDTDNLRDSSSDPPVKCSGQTSPKTVQDGTVTTSWTMKGEAGPTGEGVIDITVTAKHSAGPTVVLSDRLSCYDVYPSPTVDTPAPCPTPTTGGGGR